MELAEIIQKTMELERQYEEKYQGESEEQLYPEVWYSIKDFDLRIQLFEEALRMNKKLSELEYIQRLANAELDTRLRQNLEKSAAILNEKIEKGMK